MREIVQSFKFSVKQLNPVLEYSKGNMFFKE